MIAYRALLDVPRDLVRFVSRLLAAERRVRSTRRRTRALTCGKQALFVLVWFRKREDLAVLDAGFAISRATAYRYAAEGRAVLAARAPQLSDALERVAANGWSHVILDGTVLEPTGVRRPPRVAPVTSSTPDTPPRRTGLAAPSTR